MHFPPPFRRSAPRHIRGTVEKVPLGALTIEADGEKVSFELLHHGLEVVVTERLLVVEACGSEHAVDQAVDVLLAQLLRLGDVDEGVEQL